jgi:hypothetical protein
MYMHTSPLFCLLKARAYVFVATHLTMAPQRKGASSVGGGPVKKQKIADGGLSCTTSSTCGDSKALSFLSHPTVVFIRLHVLDLLAERLDTVVAMEAVSHGGCNVFQKEALLMAMKPGGDGELLCTVKVTDFATLDFAHGQANLPTIGGIKQESADQCKNPGWKIPMPVAVDDPTNTPKVGALKRQGGCAHYFGMLHAWATALKANDVELVKVFDGMALCCKAKFVRAGEKEQAAEVKWRFSHELTRMAEHNVLHGVRLSLGLLAQMDELIEIRQRKVTCEDCCAALCAHRATHNHHKHARSGAAQ